MHKTISCGSDNSYGIKADDLFVLDKHELTSSFVAISYEAICNSLGTETLKGLDNRGSENRGRDFEQATWHQLGQVEMLDQMKGNPNLPQTPGYTY